MAASSSSSALPPPRVTLNYAPSERRVVLSFPGGRLPASQLLPKGEGGLKLKVKEKGDEIKSLTADTSDGACRWTGKVHANDTQKLLVAEYDRSTGTVRLLPARAYSMTASIRTPTAALERPAVRVADGDPEAGDGYLAKRALVNELGAEKAKKRLRAAEAKRVRADAVHDQAGLAGDVTALDAAAALAPPKPSEQERKALHPRFNLGATTVADAFPRAGIVPDFIWDRLDVKELPTAAALGASNVLEVAAAAEGWPPFVLEQLRANLPGATDAAERKRRQRGLLFLSHMAAFLALRRDDRDAIVPAEAPAESDNARGAVAHCKWIPAAVWGQLYATFTEKTSRGAPPAAASGDGEGKRAITSPMATKLYYHILALALLVTGGKITADQFAGPPPALGLSLKKVQFHLRQLGCAMAKSKADADKGATIATLKLPLAFPKESRGAPAARR